MKLLYMSVVSALSAVAPCWDIAPVVRTDKTMNIPNMILLNHKLLQPLLHIYLMCHTVTNPRRVISEPQQVMKSY